MSEEPVNELLKEIDAAAGAKDLSKVQRLTGLPVDVITGQRMMTRKERRKWYRDNKVRLRLPKWGQLKDLNEK